MGAPCSSSFVFFVLLFTIPLKYFCCLINAETPLVPSLASALPELIYSALRGFGARTLLDPPRKSTMHSENGIVRSLQVFSSIPCPQSRASSATRIRTSKSVARPAVRAFARVRSSPSFIISLLLTDVQAEHVVEDVERPGWSKGRSRRSPQLSQKKNERTSLEDRNAKSDL